MRTAVLALVLLIGSACSTAPSSLTADPATPSAVPSSPAESLSPTPAPSATPSPTPSATVAPTPSAPASSFDPAPLRAVLLGAADLPSGFQPGEDTARTAADLARAYADSAAREQQLRELGFQGGWRRTFSRADARTNLEVHLGLSRYLTAEGAARALEEARSSVPPVDTPERVVREILPSPLGAQGHLLEIRTTTAGYVAQFFIVLARQDAQIVSVQVIGLGTPSDPDLALSLARAQLARLAPAR